MFKSQIQRRNFEGNKRKERRYIQGNPHETIDEFFNRNFSSQERMGQHIQNAETKKPVSRELYSQ